MIILSLGPIVEGSPGPESYQCDELGNENEHIPEVINLEGPRPGLLDPRSGIDNCLSSPDELPDENKFVDTSALERFSFMLREAQCHAIELENEKVKAKRKTLKMYLGNLKVTIACHEKAHQVLALRGFHNVFSFISLKEREQLAGRRRDEDNTPSNCLSPSAVEEVSLLNVGASSAVNKSCCSSPGGGNEGFEGT